jgi:hypothetical protein
VPYGYAYSGRGSGYGGDYREAGRASLGSIRLRVVRAAKVYIDGGLVGTVDEFDGLSDHLELGQDPRLSSADGFSPTRERSSSAREDADRALTSESEVTAGRLLSVVAGVSLVRPFRGDRALAATDSMAAWFGAPVPNPILFAKLNGLFLIAVGLGYAPAIRHPQAHRPYLWIFGPLLKGAGAATFVIDHVMNGSPTAFLLFAVSDGALAAVTLMALLARHER